MTSWMSQINFDGLDAPGKVYHRFKVSPLVNNGFHCVSLEYQSLRIGFIIFSTLIAIWYILAYFLRQVLFK